MPVLVGAFGLGPFEMLLILAVVVIIFGVGRLPEVGGAVGKGIREFRKASRDDDDPKQITQAQSTTQTPPPPTMQTPPGQPMSLVCHQCGTANTAVSKFCSQCGTSLKAAVE
jgi:sec-independent protein translocase protein TatA